MTDFKLIKNEYIKDVSSDCYYYKHKTGAKIIYLKNDDNNRVFMVCFKTQAKNNCGTAHIVEHCTLCGSEKYKLKDPFNILDKSTIHTYLNAITYPDKTVYPVASTNQQDLYTMADVYLDGIFNPLMVKNEGIFQQEGWQCGENGINGVVYNEMKGVFSLPLRTLKHKLQEQLYENTCYKYYSGGLPQYIPQLSYREFIDYYKEKYHPSNSIFYLYGNLDLDKYLNLINDYINVYEKKEIPASEYKLNTDFNDISISVKNNNKKYLMAVFNTGTAVDYIENVANQILVNALFNNENSSLRQQLLGIGSVVNGEYDNSKYYSDLTISIENSTAHINELKKILNTFKNKDISSELIQSEINKLKFYIMEKDFGYKPKGLYYGIDVLNGFLYNNEDFTAIKYNFIFEEIKKLDFKQLYIKLLNKGVFGEINNNFLAEKEISFNKPVNITHLKAYQDKIDEPKELNKIKVINSRDISKDIVSLNSIINNNIIYTPINSNITYIDFAFDISNLSMDLIEYLGIYIFIIEKINPELSEKIKFYLGDLRFHFSTFIKGNSYIPVLILRAKFLNEYTEKAIQCINELLFNINFNNEEIIHTLINEQKQLMNKSLISNGTAFAVNYALSCCDERYKLVEMITGIDFINFLSVNNTCIGEKLEAIKKILFTQDNCTISYGCIPKEEKRAINKILFIYNQLPKKDITGVLKPLLNSEMGICINSMVNYNALVGKITEYNGYFKVLKQIINGYLWDNVRIKGGAYGAVCDFYRSGYYKISSYRDPRVKDTFNDFYNISKWLSNFNISQDEINRHIIGAINILDMPVKDNIKTLKALSNYYGNLTDDKLLLEKEQVLGTNLVNIKDQCEKINIKNGIKISVGNERNIAESKLYNKFMKFS